MSLRINIWFLYIYLLPMPLICINQTYDVHNVDINNYPGSLVITNMKIVGRDRSINGTVIFLQDLTKYNWFSLELYSYSDNYHGYKLMPMEIPPTSICTALKSFYDRFIKSSIQTGIQTDFDFKDGNICPLPKGDYWLKNVLLNTTDWVTILPRGLIKAKLSVFERFGTYGGGFEVVVNIVDKNSK